MAFQVTQELAQQYADGVPARLLAAPFGVSDTTFRRAARALIETRKVGGQQKYFCDESAFHILTEEAAYWVGMLMADGSISGDRVRLSLKRSDRQHLMEFGKFLRTHAPVWDLTNGQSCIEVHALKLVHVLAKYGVVPRKTLTAAAPDWLARNKHFWRGAVDGDGCLHEHKLGYPMVAFCGSHALVDQFLAFVRTVVPSKAKATDRGNYAAVVLGGTRYAELVRTLYSGAAVSLPRKKSIADRMTGVTL